jgi:hypothetical protein
MPLLSFDIDREGLEGIEGRTDKELLLEWLKVSYTLSAPVDAFSHMMWNSVFDKIQRCQDDAVELTEREHYMLRIGLIRANISGQGSRMYVQLLRKFGEEIPE